MANEARLLSPSFFRRQGLTFNHIVLLLLLLQGFSLQEADLNAVIAAARRLEEGIVNVDPQLAQVPQVDMVLRTIRLLQIALEFQFKENADLTDDYNELQVSHSSARPHMHHARRACTPHAAAGPHAALHLSW